MNKTWLLAAISCVCFGAYADEKKDDEPKNIEVIVYEGQGESTSDHLTTTFMPASSTASK